MSEPVICPVCENGSPEPLAPRIITVGKIKGEAWCCKSCAARAADHIGYAGHILTLAIRDTVAERSPPPDPDDAF